MEAIENILSRRSVRKFQNKPISGKVIKEILTAAMSGPSCANVRDWSFIVVTKKDVLNQMADANGNFAWIFTRNHEDTE